MLSQHQLNAAGAGGSYIMSVQIVLFLQTSSIATTKLVSRINSNVTIKDAFPTHGNATERMTVAMDQTRANIVLKKRVPTSRYLNFLKFLFQSIDFPSCFSYRPSPAAAVV